jgi:hypothetical protein
MFNLIFENQNNISDIIEYLFVGRKYTNKDLGDIYGLMK